MKKRDGAGRYDVIVIGGGWSGLVCANYIAREGKRVLLLERAARPGGCMSGFWRKGYYFDAGAQSFESGGVAFPILKDLGLYDMHRWEKCGYRVKTPGRDFVVSSLDAVEANFQSEFPREPGIRVVFDEIRKFAVHFEKLMALAGDPTGMPLGAVMDLFKLAPAMGRWTHPAFRAKLCSAIVDPTLRHWFTHYGYSHMPFHLFAGFWHFWAHDYWYPAGGLQALSDRLAKKIQDCGGEVRFRTAVDRILVDHRKATGVLTDQGERLRADQVVYTGDYKRLVFHVLGEGSFRNEFVRKVRQAKVTESFAAVYLGLDMPREELRERMGEHHVVYFPDYRCTLPRAGDDLLAHSRTSIELSSPSFASEGLAPEGRSSLIIQTLTTAQWQNYWHNGGLDTERTPAYRKLKREVAKQLIRSAEQVIPGLGKKITLMEVSTPLTLNRYTWNTDGASAGWGHDQSRGAFIGRWGYLKLRQPVEGLYTAGHYSFWPGGVPSVMASGKFAAGFVLKKRPYAQAEKWMRRFGR